MPQTRRLVNSATGSKVHPGPTFSGGLNVWTAGVGGGDGGGGGVWMGGEEEERGRSCVGMGGGVWEGEGGIKEGGRKREERR